MIRYIRPDGFTGSEYVYKVQEYIDAVIAHEEDDVINAEVKALINTFNEYAKNINKVTRGEGTPAEITDVNDTNFVVQNSVSYNINAKNEQTGYIKLERTYDNLMFEFGEVLKFKVNFTLTGVSSDFKFYINGEEVKASITDTGYFCVETEINVCDFDKALEIKVTHAGGSELVLNTSALGVAKRMLMSNTSTADEKNLMKAIYKFYTAAVAYVTPDVTE